MSLFDFFVDHKAEILRSMWEGVSMVGIARGLAIGSGVPLGVLVTRSSKLRVPVLGVSNVIQTIPSLALFGFLLPLPWLAVRSERVAITALVLYALLPVIHNTYAGIIGVDPAVREVGKAMGMTDWQLLFKVDLQLAMGTSMAGHLYPAGDGHGVCYRAPALACVRARRYSFLGCAWLR